jgi:putative thioredoxin
VIIDFWADWCEPCKIIGAVLERVAQRRKGGVLIARINVDQEAGIVQHFGVDKIPTLKIVAGGQLVADIPGEQLSQFLRQPHILEQALNEVLDKFSGSAADPLVEKAKAQEKKNPAEAEALYRKALEKDAENSGARVGLARVLLAQKKTEGIAELIDPISSESPDYAEAQQIKATLALSGLADQVTADEDTLRQRIADNPKDAQAHYELGCALAMRAKHEEALEMLLSAGELDPALAAGKVREAMVQIFYALGPSHPLSDKYRSKLARLLY